MTAVSPVGPAVPAVAADEAFESLYERHSSRVFGYCLRRLRSREEAEDAVQTTFLYAMCGLRRGIVPEVDEAWLFAIARNVCLTRIEVAHRHTVEVASDPQLLEDTLAAPAPPDDLADLAEALSGLTEAQRRAILLREWQGLSYREIAAELELSQAAVETLLFRARRSLAARLRGAGCLLPWFRSFAESGAGSLAVGATVVALTAAGSVDGTRRHPQSRPSVSRASTAVVAKRHGLDPPTSLRRRLRGPAPEATPRVTASPPARGAPATGSPPQAAETPVHVSTATLRTLPAPHTVAAAAATTTTGDDAAASATRTVVSTAAGTTGSVESVAEDAVAATTDAVASAVSTTSAPVQAAGTLTVAPPPPLP